MKTHVEFRSSAFPPYPGEEAEINPGRFGRRVADFVAASLNAAGFQAEMPSPEDWGWLVSLRNEPFPIRVGCGNYEEYPDGFLCFIEPHQPYVRRWFRKVHAAPRVEAVMAALETATGNHPEIRDIRWWTYDEFNNPTS